MPDCQSTEWLSERYDKGFLDHDIHIDRHGLDLLTRTGKDQGVKRQLAAWATVGPRFDYRDIVKVEFAGPRTSDAVTRAEIRVKRGSRALGTFVAAHAHPQVSWASLEPDELAVDCGACGESLILKRSSLEQVVE